MELKTFVRQRLAQLKISIADAETAGGLRKGFITDILRNQKSSVRGDNLNKLAAALQCSTDAILAGQISRAGNDAEQLNRREGRAASTSILTLATRRLKAIEPPPQGEIEVAPRPPYPGAIPEAEARLGAGGLGAPFFRFVPTGAGGIVEVDSVHDWWVLPPSVIRDAVRSRPENVVIFKIMSDSMEPEILRTDYVLIDIGRRTLEPTGIWALDEGFGLVLKRIIPKKKNGEVRLILRSSNKEYPDEERAIEEVTIIGKYVGRFTMF